MPDMVVLAIPCPTGRILGYPGTKNGCFGHARVDPHSIYTLLYTSWGSTQKRPFWQHYGTKNGNFGHSRVSILGYRQNIYIYPAGHTLGYRSIKIYQVSFCRYPSYKKTVDLVILG